MKAMIPDRSYAGIYQATIDDCKQHGAFDVRPWQPSPTSASWHRAPRNTARTTRRSRSRTGNRSSLDANGQTLFEHAVEKGDIWRMCRTRDLPIRDWVKLAVTRARATGHGDLLARREQGLRPQRHREGATLPEGSRHRGPRHPDPVADRGSPGDAETYPRRPRYDFGDWKRAARLSHRSVSDSRARDQREDALHRAAPRWRRAVETGAGGSRPNTCSSSCRRTTCAGIRWESFWRWPCRSRISEPRPANRKALVVADALDRRTRRSSTTTSHRSARSASWTTAAATSISPCIGHARLPDQSTGSRARVRFGRVASELEGNEAKIVGELNGVQRKPVQIGGYYHLIGRRRREAMRPSATLNAIIDGMNS